MKYRQLNKQDRITIEIQLKRWSKQKEIAEIIWCSPWTISREIKRNSVRKKWTKKRVYLSKEAQLKSYQRCWRSKIQSMKINMNSKLKLYIIDQLKRKDILASPKIIANKRNEHIEERKSYISFVSIYKWLETWDWNKYKRYLPHKFNWYRKKNKLINNSKDTSKIIWRVDIENRPVIINNRSEEWHFEADLIVSKKWFKWSLLTIIDRKTRLPRIFKLKDKSSENIMNLIAGIKDELWIKSVTFDNWMEFAKHYLLNDIWIDTYFCKPYSSWEKWSIENLNKIIRRFFPKWTIFDNISEEKIKSVCDIIANTPREILWFISPNQAHFQ